MDVKGSHTYAAPIESLLTMFRDEKATAAKYEGMGHRDVEILECEATDDTIRIVSNRVVDVDLPGFAKKVLKPTNTMRQTDQWRRSPEGRWDGTFAVEVHGAPVKISGEMHLTPGDGTCTHDVTMDIAVKVPLVGGKIADWMAKNDVRKTLDAEFAAGDRWVAEHPS